MHCRFSQNSCGSSHHSIQATGSIILAMFFNTVNRVSGPKVRPKTTIMDIPRMTKSLQKLTIEGDLDSTDSGIQSDSGSISGSEVASWRRGDKLHRPARLKMDTSDDEGFVSCDGAESSYQSVSWSGLEPITEEYVKYSKEENLNSARHMKQSEPPFRVLVLPKRESDRKRKRAYDEDVNISDSGSYTSSDWNDNGLQTRDVILESTDSLLDTWEFQYVGGDSDSGNKSQPELSPAEHNTRLQRTMFYAQKADNGETFLQNVILAGEEELARLMIEDVVTYLYLDVKNSYGQTALHIAVIQNLPRVVRRLLAHGASPDIRDHHGNSPLHIAVAKGYILCVESLTRHLVFEEVKNVPYTVPFRLIPQNLEARNYEGKGLLHIAVQNAHINIIIFLVKEMHVNVNIQDGKCGKTPLHLAAELNLLDVAECLVQHCGANLHSLTYNGQSPLDMALDRQFEEMVNFLCLSGSRDRNMNGFSDSDDSDYEG